LDCTQQPRGEVPLRKNDAIDDVDHPVAGFDVRKNDVGGAAVRVGKNAAALGCAKIIVSFISREID